MIRMITSLFLVFALVATAEPVQAAGDRVFRDEVAGFSLKRPKDWVFLTGQELVAHALHEEGEESGPAPVPGLLVVVARHPEPHPDLNATVQVVRQPLGPARGVPPMVLMNALVQEMAKSMQEFEVLEEASETKVSGLPAARLRVAYTVHTDEGKTYRIIARMWTVVRDDEVFIIDMNGHAEGPEVSEREFRKIFKSIRITAAGGASGRLSAR